MELRHLQARRGGLRAAGRILGGVEPLRDGHGRTIADLRVSVTDRCNFRCQYCMPAEGLPWLERDELLTLRGDRAPRRRCSPRLGVDDVRLTGGEPLVRRDFPRLVAMLRRDRGRRRPLADHQRLPARARRRRRSSRPGIDARQRLDRLARSATASSRSPAATRCRRCCAGSRRSPRYPAAAPDQGQRGRDARLHRGRGRCAFAELARRAPYQVRFIEFMPLDADHAWTPDQVLTGEEIRAMIDARLPARGAAARAARDRARLPLRRRRAARSASSTRSREPFCARLQPHPPDRRGQAAHLPVLAPRDRPARAAARRRRPTTSSSRSSATRSGARSSSTRSTSRASSSRRGR